MRKSLDLVIQPENEKGCGLACIAAITGATYESLKNKLIALDNWRITDGEFRTEPHDLISLLTGIDLDHQLVKINSIAEIEHPTIVAVNKIPKKNKYHWVVAFKTNGRIYILDTEWGGIYLFEYHKDDYKLYKKRDGIAFPKLDIKEVKFNT